MGTSAVSLLDRPVRLNGVHLGRPTDLLIDLEQLRALGIEVQCTDGVARFLPFAAARVRDDAIEVGSALLLLEDDRFYRERGRGLSSLRGFAVLRGRTDVGALSDVVVGPVGEILELLAHDSGTPIRVAVGAAVRLVAPRRAA